MGFKSYNTIELVLVILFCAAQGALSEKWEHTCKDVSGKALGMDSDPLDPEKGKPEDGWPMWIRVPCYLLGLMYAFYAVGLISDVFMSGIDKVTSKKVRKQDPVTLRYTTSYAWNATVANLSLMALGSSAPEIMLGCIEVSMGDYLLGPLGPGVIVGSAAFNLLCISAACVSCHEEGKTTKIKEVPVYIITATFSVLAYIWLYLIIAVISPDVVTTWEGIVTAPLFPVLLILAYLADRGHITFGIAVDDAVKRDSVCLMEGASKEETAQIEYLIRQEHGQDLSDEQVLGFMNAQYRGRRNKAFYQHAGLQKVFHGKEIDTTYMVEGKVEGKRVSQITQGLETSDDNEGEKNARTIKISFHEAAYACLESACVGKFRVTRTGPDSGKVTVKYKTIAGSAEVKKHFEPVDEAVLTFEEKEKEKVIEINVVNDNAYEEDRDFFVELYDPVVDEKNFIAALGSIPKAQMTIIDDDVPGKFRFKEQKITVETEESNQIVGIVVERFDGSCGTIECNYKTEAMNYAVAGVDYEHAEGKVTMEDGVMSSTIEVTILASTRYLNKATFLVNLSDAKCTAGTQEAQKLKVCFDKSTDGDEEGEVCQVELVGKSSETRDKLLSKMQSKLRGSRIAHLAWLAQFQDAIFKVVEDDEEEEEDGGEDNPEGSGENVGPKGPTPLDYVFHFAGIPWKLLFAFVPPTDYCGGYPTFIVALFFIGFVTLIVGDLAELLGCAIYFPAEITAITFVALGTSLPDTFASMASAKMDPYADDSIGNVTGSNSVNVFLGCGLAWTLGAVYWALTPFDATKELMINAYGGNLTHYMKETYGSLNPDNPTATDLWLVSFSEKTDSEKDNILKIMDCEDYAENGCKSDGTAFMVPAGSLWFNLVVFSLMALLAIAHLYARRWKHGGELGGPKKSLFLGQYVSSTILVSQWLFYIAASSWYCIAMK